MEKKISVKQNRDLDPGEVARFVQIANQYTSSVYIELDDNRRVNAKSIMGMMNFLADNGQEVTLVASGEDEAAAIEAVALCLTKEG